MTFGENLKALRNSRNISQRNLAEELGFSFQNISKWERNESLPDIETLIAIARFFGTTTDSLLGYSQAEKFSKLKLDESKIKIYSDYPQEEEKVTGKLIFAIGGEGKIVGIVFVPPMRGYRGGYIGENYELFDEGSTIIYECSCNSRGGRIVDDKKIRIPDNGFLISVSDSTFTAKQIMKFIIPEEHIAYLDADLYSGYYNGRNGHFLFSDILKQNELDHISVEFTKGELLFKKPADIVDTMSVNIEVLARIVRKELQKEYIKQIEELKNKLDEIEDLTSDNEGSIDELSEKIEELENKIDELTEKESDETEIE